MKFKSWRIYRHSSPNCSLDIRVCNVYHENEERVKLRVQYACKTTGRLQYTGRGSDLYSDKVEIKKEDFDNWRLEG